jgi:UDP-2-acetamido-2,6-beta-L-arabino-hexul-4-ose reductase
MQSRPSTDAVRIVITGADGFVGMNLQTRLRERQLGELTCVTRDTADLERLAALMAADIVVHLAGVNRPVDASEFSSGNTALTEQICDVLRGTGRAIPVIFSSSIQAALDNAYGQSKRLAEDALMRYGAETGAGIAILRLVNVFGKWCRPNYNSAVATFCHNTARDLPIVVANPDAVLRLVHIDAVVDAIIELIHTPVSTQAFVDVEPVYETTVGAVAEAIRGFAESRRSLAMPRVGTGFLRALYSTYVSYLPPESFGYALARHEDPRGVFAEVLRTPDSGQFSFFTAHPGVTRGGHYHHTKTEKFLVVKGAARFGFRHIVTGEYREMFVSGAEARVIETVPGWAHEITNIGDDEMYVLLWANECFDAQNPDTVTARVFA